MQVVAVRKSITVPVEKGHNTITLGAGVRYVMHDTEVDRGIAAGVWKRVDALPEAPGRFNPRQACTGRLLVPFIGRLGEAISMLPILASIRRQYPQLTIDVTTTPVNGAPKDTTAASLGTTTRCGHKRSPARCLSVYRSSVPSRQHRWPPQPDAQTDLASVPDSPHCFGLILTFSRMLEH